MKTIVWPLTAMLTLLMLAGCSGSPEKPSHHIQICEELDDEERWLEPVVINQQRYGTPMALSLALLELPLSDLDKKHVRPRAADWDEYRIRSERWDASPYMPEDAVDFIGWFSRQSRDRNGISWDDAASHYLALRLGHGGLHRLEPGQFPELQRQAEAVAQRATRWNRELQGCTQLWRDQGWFNSLKFW
ncbi:hypothetical protein [Neptuniibacter halophilus]|uniref:transglycosylase SLT domain-containing protein n=1 Tax=Neptuniibacter halophilus TaxID=651666 RepID=UPI0025733C45|nr:hypothetical protein [Neptuniibacter halophilus]